jgi:hypothetical protein
MEIHTTALGATNVKRRATILDRVTLFNKGIHMWNPDIFMWI